MVWKTSAVYLEVDHLEMVTRDNTRESTPPVSKEATTPPKVLSQKDAKQPSPQSPITGNDAIHQGESDMLERMNEAAQNSESTPTHGVNGVHLRGYHGVHGVRKSCPRCRHVTCTCNPGKDRRNPGKDFWILLALLISPRSKVV